MGCISGACTSQLFPVTVMFPKFSWLLFPLVATVLGVLGVLLACVLLDPFSLMWWQVAEKFLLEFTLKTVVESKTQESDIQGFCPAPN